MNRTGASILGFVILLALVAGPSARQAPELPVVASPTWQASSPESSALSGARALKKCVIGPETFEFRLIDAVRQEYNRGANPEEGCVESFHIDGVRKPLTHVLFAIVPNPVHTNLALLFDQQMDALQQGVLDSGWSFEKALMPWDAKAHPESTDFRIRLQQQLFEGEQENQPGILLFRRTQSPAKNESELNSAGSLREKKRKPKERLLVFVIGESPTGGINKSQFQQALQLVKNFFNDLNQRHLSILGPTFSGSLHSLAAILDCNNIPAYPCGQITVMSGTATSQSSLDAFHTESGLPIKSLQENDEYVVRLFLRFARETWKYEPEQVAILSEDETAYGIRGIETSEWGSNTKHHPDRINAQGNELDGEDEQHVLHVYFPREISQLRAAYQRVVEGHRSGSSKIRTTLPLDLDSSASNDDTVPEYSGKQLPLAQEAVLLGIVAELQAHHTDLVLLRSTNALDQLFLSRYLRQAYPDARIIAVSADLLFAREIEDAQLHGVMALTTYSLTPAADHAFHSENEIHSDRVFPNTHAVGTYNATKLLLAEQCLGQQEQCKLDGQNSQSVHLFQYGWPALSNTPTAPRHPPVHLTVLGHGGFWEVAILPEKAYSTSVDQTPTQNNIARSSLPLVNESGDHANSPASLSARENLERQQPPAWHVLWILAIAASLAYAYFIWFPSITSSSQAVAQLAPPLFNSRRNLLVVTAGLHFSMLLAVLWPYRYLFHESRLEIACLIAAMVVVAVVGVTDLYRRQCFLQSAALRLRLRHDACSSLDCLAR